MRRGVGDTTRAKPLSGEGPWSRVTEPSILGSFRSTALCGRIVHDTLCDNIYNEREASHALAS